MKKSLFIAALATVALASCSKNEVIELQQDQIKFSAVTDNASRGPVVTTATLDKFYAWGWAGSTLYFSDVTFTGSVGNNFTSTPAYWWPAEAMKFYATNLADVDLSSGTFNYTVDATIANQKDLLYAAMFNQGKQDAVNLNFRHALSQILFQVGLDAKGNNQPITVDITKIILTGIDGTATFTMPTENTNDPDYSDDKDGSNETEISGKGWGTWTNVKEADFTATEYSLVKVLEISNSDYTQETYSAYSEESDAMLLLPQNLNSASLNVYCKITAKAADGTTDVVLHDATTTPLTHTFTESDVWKQGKKYIYKIKFGANLSTIQFKVTVDEYQLGITTPIEL